LNIIINIRFCSRFANFFQIDEAVKQGNVLGD